MPAPQTRDDPREAGGTGARDEATALRPERPRRVLRPTAALFGGLALARRDRSMHGPGLAYRCRVEIDPPPGYVQDAALFAEAAAHDATRPAGASAGGSEERRGAGGALRVVPAAPAGA